MNEILEKEKLKFMSSLGNRNNNEKKLYHYKSVLNLCNGLISLSNLPSHIPFKKLMLKYFNLIDDSDYLISQKESLIYYKKFILPIGGHLINNSGFRPKGNIYKYIIIGIIIDFGTILFLKKYYLIATSIMFFFGHLRQKRKIKQGKFFSIYW